METLNTDTQIRIIDATKEDSEMIADAILEAVGEDIVNNMGERDTVRRIFRSLAEREDSQYSYNNTRIALGPDGEKAGVCISYDGGKLIELRRSFFNEARGILGWQLTDEEIDNLPGETSGEEFYLDTLATLPQYRGLGIASALISDAAQKATIAALPLGLLVADHNQKARQLYEKAGFIPVGRRPFAGEMMTNMRRI